MVEEFDGVVYRAPTQLAYGVAGWLFGGVTEEDVGCCEILAVVRGGVAVMGRHRC